MRAPSLFLASGVLVTALAVSIGIRISRAALAGPVGQGRPARASAPAEEAPAIRSAQQVVERAQLLAKSGDLRQAIDVVQRQVDGERDRRARGLLLFTLGWLHQQAAARPGGAGPTEALDRAAVSYRQVLELFPEHPAATENLALVLRDLGRPQEAATLLRATIHETSAPEESYPRLITIGQLSEKEGKLEAALDTYLTAMEILPARSDAPLRIVGLYDRFNDPRGRLSDRFAGYCEAIAGNGFPRIASRGYESILRASWRGPENRAEGWLTRWLELESSSGALTRASRARLPSPREWQSEELIELVALLRDPIAGSRNLRSWLQGDLRRHTIALALASLGREFELSGDVKAAAELCERAQDLAPPFDAYRDGSELRGRPLVFLELGGRLGLLYHTNPQLDPDGRKFGQLEERLLGEKNSAYLDQDLTSMQEFHTTLGLVYAERGAWTPGSLRAAPYHLTRAVEVAQRLAGRDPGEYKPLPHVAKVHAEGLTKDTPYRDPRRARELYLDAAMGYLDQDNFVGAEEALKAAGSLNEQPGPRPKRFEDLETILKERRRVREAAISELDDVRTTLDVRRDGSVLEEPFVRRQQLRALTDLGRKARLSGRGGDAERIRSEVFETILAGRGATERDLERVLEVYRAPDLRRAAPPKTGRPERLLQGEDVRQIRELQKKIER